MNGRTRVEEIREEIRGQAEAVASDSPRRPDAVRSGAREEFSRLMADAEDLVRKVAHLTDADIAQVRQKLENTLVVARKAAEQSTARVKAGATHLANATDGYVQQRPWTAVGIAAAAGVLVGLLSSRR